MRIRLLSVLSILTIFVGLTETANARHGRRAWRHHCRPACYVRSPWACPYEPGYYTAPRSATAARSAATLDLQRRRLQPFDASTFPDVPRPQPTSHTFNNCPPEGDVSGDTALNLRKNRDDEGQYVPVRFDTILNLPQPPPRVHRVFRANWSDADTQAVARFEGTPVRVEGFLAGARQEKGEKCNCNGGADSASADPAMCDIHIWLTAQPVKDRTRAVVVEVTPRGKDKHTSWTETALNRLARNGTPVRVSGWLMFDQDHYEQLDATRGTLWEIHPIMQIEFQQNGQWTKLD